MEPSYKLMKHLGVALTVLSAVGCSVSQDSQYEQNSDTQKITVFISGEPAPSYNIEELSEETGSQPVDFLGTWNGMMKKYNKGKLTEVTFNITFYNDAGKTFAEVSDSTDRNNIDKVLVTYTPPILSYEVPSNIREIAKPHYRKMYMSNLVVFDDEMKGVYRIKMTEFGGKAMYSSLDVNLIRAPE